MSWPRPSRFQKAWRRVRRRVLPSRLRLRLDERRIDRFYRPLIANATGHDREATEAQQLNERGMIWEERQNIRMRRLFRLAWKYRTVVIPERTAGFDAWEDDN